VDQDGDAMPDPVEASGLYGPGGYGAEPVETPLPPEELTGIDFTILDPQDRFKEYFGDDVEGAAGEGTLVSFVTDPVSVSAGVEVSSVVVTMKVGASGIGEGGELVLGVPPGWPTPQTSNSSLPGYVVVSATNPGNSVATSACTNHRANTKPNPVIWYHILPRSQKGQSCSLLAL